MSRNERHVAIYGSHHRQGKRWELTGTEKELKEAMKLAIQHPPKHCFVRNPLPNVVLGDHDRDICKIDWDQMPIFLVKRYSRMMMKRSNLGGFIILESSSRTRHVLDEQLGKVVWKYKVKSYHIVFNEPVTYDKLVSMLAWLSMVVKDGKLTEWFLMQLIKGTFTLRHGFKGKTKPPKIIYRYGKQDKKIAEFLANRKFILGFLREVSRSEGEKMAKESEELKKRKNEPKTLKSTGRSM